MVLLKNTNRNSKPGWEIWLETQIRNLRQQTKMIRQRRNAGICWDKKEKAKSKTNKTPRGNKPEDTVERRLKRYRDRINNIDKRGHCKTTKKFYKQGKGECTITCQQLDDKKIKLFWSTIWKQSEHNRKTKWISDVGKEIERLEESPKEKIHLNSLTETLKKSQIGKKPSHVSIHGCWFKKFTSIQDRLAIEMNRCLSGNRHTRLDDLRKDCSTMWVGRQSRRVCFGAKPDKGFLDMKSRRIRKW